MSLSYTCSYKVNQESNEEKKRSITRVIGARFEIKFLADANFTETSESKLIGTSLSGTYLIQTSEERILVGHLHISAIRRLALRRLIALGE